MKNCIGLKIEFNGVLHVLNSKKNIRKLYNDLYDATDILFKEYNPCQVYDGECFCGRTKINKKSFCCNGCRHLSESGCTVRSLACKLHICDGLWRKAQLPASFLQEQKKIHYLAYYYLDMLHVRGGANYSVRMSAKHIGRITGQTIE